MNAKLIDLGWCIAKLDASHDFLTIVSPAAYEAGARAESIVIYGQPILEALLEAYPLSGGS